MFPKVVSNCFILCLLVVICIAAPSRYKSPKWPKKDYDDPSRHKTPKWPNENYDDPFRLPDVRTSDETDFNISGLKLKVRNTMRGINTVDTNISRSGNDDSISDTTEDYDLKTGNDGENDPVYNESPENNDEGEINNDENNDIPSEDIDQTANEVDDNLTETDGENNIENLNTELSDENNVVPPSPSDDKEIVTPNLCKLWEPGKIGVKYDTKKLSSLASFKLSSDEIKKFKIWPKATIPFLIDEFSYGKVLRDKIRDYLDNAGSLSGLNFQELPNPPEDDNERWVFIVNRRGQLDCKDYSTDSFTNSGVQKMVIGYDCLNNKGNIAALVLALAGVPSQHNAPDRDHFVNVSMESILPEKKHLFKRLNDGDWLFHDIEYDYDSAGHYPSHKYTADGSSTITVLSKTAKGPIQEPNTFSCTDLQKIRMLYNNISQNHRRIKLDTCNALYRPGPSSGSFKLINSQNDVPERPKPKKYLAAIAKGNRDQKVSALKMHDMRGEVLSDLDR